jgi:nucleotide-binding universal stress UspA family protein
MPKPILVAYDPKTGDRAPVNFGVAAAAFTGAPLIIGSVYAGGVVAGQMGHGHMDEELAEDASVPLDHLERQLRADGIKVECRPLQGTSVPHALHNAAEEFGIGLIVVGSTDRGRLGRVMPGSTAERLMHGAPCPIVVVPHGWERGSGLQTIGVAWADTPEGHEALEGAMALARRAGAKVRLLRAVHPREFGRAAGGRPGAEATSFDAVGAEMSDAKRAMCEEATKLAPGVEVEADISAQDAADFLIAASANVDLLICGSRGYGPQRAVLLGGVSRKVTAGAQCPVIILARGVKAGLEALVDEQAGAPA